MFKSTVFYGFCTTLFLMLFSAQAKSLDYKSIELSEFHNLTPVTLESLDQSKPTYIKMWATWCQPCIEQMPHFENLYQQYGDTINILAVNININEDRSRLSEVIERFDLTMPVLLDNEGQLGVSLGLVGTPYSVLINTNNEVVYTTHESDAVLDGFLSRLAQGQELPSTQAEVFTEDERLRLLEPWLQGEHLLFFTATWCDWYLADSRPEMASQCESAQAGLNSLSQRLPDKPWHGIVNHLWTDEQALSEFNQLYNMEITFNIDRSGVLFNAFKVRSIPTLLYIRDGEIILEINTFDDEDIIVQQLSQISSDDIHTVKQ